MVGRPWAVGCYDNSSGRDRRDNRCSSSWWWSESQLYGLLTICLCHCVTSRSCPGGSN